MIEAAKIAFAILFILGGVGGFILVCAVIWEWLCRDKRYDNW